MQVVSQALHSHTLGAPCGECFWPNAAMGCSLCENQGHTVPMGVSGARVTLSTQVPSTQAAQVTLATQG